MRKDDDRHNDRFKRPSDRRYPDVVDDLSSEMKPVQTDSVHPTPSNSSFKKRLKFARQEKARGLILRFTILLIIIILFILPRLNLQDEPRTADLTPTPQQLLFTFDALVLSEDLLFAVDEPIRGLISYSRTPLVGVPQLSPGTFGTFTYDGRVLESDPPHVTLTDAEPLRSGVIHSTTMEAGLELLRQAESAYLVDGRDSQVIDRTGYIPTPRATNEMPRPVFALNDPIEPPDNSILLVYGDNEQQAHDVAAELTARGYPSVLNLGSFSDYRGEPVHGPRLRVLHAPNNGVDPNLPIAPRFDPEYIDSSPDKEIVSVRVQAEYLSPAFLPLELRNSSAQNLTISSEYDLFVKDQTEKDGWRWIQPAMVRSPLDELSGFQLSDGFTMHSLDLTHPYPGLESGDYRFVFAIDGFGQTSLIKHVDFKLDRETTREDYITREAHYTSQNPAPKLVARIIPQTIRRGGLWMQLRSLHPEYGYHSNYSYELKVYRAGNWEHYAGLDDYLGLNTFSMGAYSTPAENENTSWEELGPYHDNSVPLFFNWEPYIGSLEPGHYRLVKGVGFYPDNDSRYTLHADFSITETTPDDHLNYITDVPAEPSWFENYLSQDYQDWDLEVSGLTDDVLEFTLGNHTEYSFQPTISPYLLRRSARPSSSIYFDSSDWFILNESYLDLESEYYELYPGQSSTGSINIENMYYPLTPGEYLLFFPLYRITEDGSMEVVMLSAFFVIQEGGIP